MVISELAKDFDYPVVGEEVRVEEPCILTAGLSLTHSSLPRTALILSLPSSLNAVFRSLLFSSHCCLHLSLIFGAPTLLPLFGTLRFFCLLFFYPFWSPPLSLSSFFFFLLVHAFFPFSSFFLRFPRFLSLVSSPFSLHADFIVRLPALTKQPCLFPRSAYPLLWPTLEHISFHPLCRMPLRSAVTKASTSVPRCVKTELLSIAFPARNLSQPVSHLSAAAFSLSLSRACARALSLSLSLSVSRSLSRVCALSLSPSLFLLLFLCLV